MAYITPSTLVYQLLKNAGGVLATSPDLNACVIGPCFNTLEYVPGSLSSMIATAALSTATTTATGSAAGFKVTFGAVGSFSVDDSVVIAGAGTGAGPLQAKITDISGNIVTLDTALVTAVTDAVVNKSGHISNSNITNTFNLPGQKPGQNIDVDSVGVVVDAAKVQTGVAGAYVFAGDTSVNVLAVATTGSITSGQSSLVLTSAAGLIVGDAISIVGAGVAGATLATKVGAIAGNTVTLANAAGTTVTGAVVTKDAVSNVNASTSTLVAEAGDQLILSYVNTSAVSKSFTTSVAGLITTSGLNGNLVSFKAADSLPADLSATTTGSMAQGSNDITVASATGLAVGDILRVDGAGAAGAALEGVITVIASNVLTLDVAAVTAVTTAKVTKANKLALSIVKTYEDLVLPAVNPLVGGANYNTANTAADGTIAILPGASTVFGKVLSGDVYVEYRALRTDLAGAMGNVETASDITGQLGEISDQNPLALAASLALANAGTAIKYLAVASDDLAGYLDAMDRLESEKVYFLSPLTQDLSILNAFKAYALRLSTPEEASWRVVLANTAIPTTKDVGQFNSNSVNTGATVELVNGSYVLNASNATFLTDGVVPGDSVHVTAGTPGSTVGIFKVLRVVSNQQVVVNATAAATDVSYHVTRLLTKDQQAQSVAAVSTSFSTNRVTHVMPDRVGVSVGGVTKYLPGYYLCAALAGMGAGFPVQQGFTNISVAGIVDLQHSNFFFTKAQLGTMASAGTCLFAQASQKGAPYCRHELTTDVSVLEYRELQQVKNWDYLSYLVKAKIDVYIGSWNITAETLNVVRQTLTATLEMEKTKKLPKVGAPLVSFNIVSLKQNAYNKDMVDVNVEVKMAAPMNYVNIYLTV